MKKITLLALSAIVILVSTTPAHADFFGTLTDKVMDKVGDTITDKLTKKAGDKTGEATDAVINPTESSDNDAKEKVSQETATEAAPTINLGGLGDMMSAMQKPVSIDDSYAFALTVRTAVTNDGKTQTLKQSMSDNAIYIEVEQKQKMIMDFNNRAMIMIDEQEKTKMAMSTDLLKQFANMAPQGDIEPHSITRISKTGKTKKILGYVTEQWTYKDQDGHGEVWIANSLDFDMVGFSKKMAEVFGNTAKSRLPLDFSQTAGKVPTGYPLESVHYLEGKEVSRTKVVEVIKQPSTVSLTGYKMQSMMGQ